MNDAPSPKRTFGCLQVLLFVAVAVVLTAAVSFFIVRAILFPPAFKPVKLNDREEKALQVKLNRLDSLAPTTKPTPAPPDDRGPPLKPEAYSETEADRTIRLTERELNALLAKNTDLADKLVIALTKDLVSANLRIPLDDDVPVIGGKVLRVKAGVSYEFADGRPVITFRGVMIMGVPLPNAWLGGMKNIDLVKEYGGQPGFWKAFAEGVESLSVEEGHVTLKLKE